MAQITNRPPQNMQPAVLDMQDFNERYSEPTIYDDTYGDHDEAVIGSRFHGDNGGVDTNLESDLEALRNAAAQTFKRRRAIIDWHTTNTSFIDVHNDLRRLGIKNNTFFLKLYDRELQGVDPYSPKLPLEMQIKIYIECVVNPWYYLREIARVPAQGKAIEPGGGDRYQLDRNNLASWYCFIHNIDHYASKPRQCGKTQDAIHKMNYAYHFGASSSAILFFNKDLALSKENLARMKDQRDLYPPYLQMRIAFDEEGNIIKGTDNITTMKNPVTNNSVKVIPAAVSKEAATRLGRGYTAPLMFFDELDFANWQTEILNASVFAYSTASKNAIENGSCACRVFCSTPGDLATRDGQNATNFIRGTKEQKGMMVWNDRMLDDPISEIKAQLYSPNYNGVMFIEHNWMQLKRSVQWYERQCNLCSYNQEIILREILLQRLAGSTMSPFTREEQLYLSSHKHRPMKTIPIRKKDVLSEIALYEKMDRRIPYIFGIDPAEGLSEDNNAMVIINPFTYKVAAEFKSPYISPKDFSELIVEFMTTYAPRGLLVVEANRGRELLQRLSDSPFQHRVWYDADRMNQILSSKTDQYGGMPQSVLARKVQGFVTGTKSRNLLFGCLEQMVKENIDCIFTENLVNEILTLVRKPSTGKIEAAPGQHDDVVMAYLIGLYVYLNASNLLEFQISRQMRAPDTEYTPAKETEEQYRQRVASAIPNIPEQYRGIFQDFLDQRDPVRDARDYRKELAQAEQEELYRQGTQQAAAHMINPMIDEGEVSFEDQSGPSGTTGTKYGVPYRPMGYQHQVFNRDEGGIMLGGDPSDYFGDAERQAFEMGIFDINFERPPDFDPDDYT